MKEDIPRGRGAGADAVEQDRDDFLEYLGAIGKQLAHLARTKQCSFLALLLDMVVMEAGLMLEARSARSRADVG